MAIMSWSMDELMCLHGDVEQLVEKVKKLRVLSFNNVVGL